MPTAPELRALVLTAGYGTRLRPLTLTLPKPLLPVCGVAVAGHTLGQLSAFGCRQVVLNLHHGADAVRGHFEHEPSVPAITFSEEAEILGTGGALYPVRGHLAEADAVVVVNGDALAQWPLRQVLRDHLQHGAAATLLVHTGVPAEAYGGGVGVNRDGRLVQLRDGEAIDEVARRPVFTGLQILSPQLVRALGEGPGDLVGDLYMPMLEAGETIRTVGTRRLWHDLGTPGRYLAGVLAWARGRVPDSVWRGRWVAETARVAESATLRRAVVESAAVADGCLIENALVMDGAEVGAGSRLRRTIVGPGVVLPPETRIEGRMVLLAPVGYQPAAEESILGSLVYTPLGEPHP